MRKKYVENTRFYSFLETLAELPDSCTTEPFYFKEFNFFDVFLIFQRVNNPLSFIVMTYRKDKASRNSFGSAVFCMSFTVSLEFFSLRLFDPTLIKLSDFVELLKIENSDFCKLISDLVTYDVPSTAFM